MARAYSLDLRERVVAFVASGQTTRAASTVFNVSVASVVKWTQRVRASGSAAAKPMGGKHPFLLEAERDWLLARLDEKPDLTLHALRDELRERGTTVSCLGHFVSGMPYLAINASQNRFLTSLSSTIRIRSHTLR
jgi:transposase